MSRLRHVARTVPAMDDLDPWVPLIALLLGFVLSPFAKRSEVRNTLRIEAGDQLADLQQVIAQTHRDDDFGAFLVTVNRLRMRLRAVGMPRGMIDVLSRDAVAAWRGYDPESAPRGSDPLPWEFSVVTEYIASWLGTANPLRHLLLRFGLYAHKRWFQDRHRGQRVSVAPDDA